MSLEFPIQNRAIDPYASYNSNVVNILTRMITRGKNCLHGVHAIDVIIDATNSDTEITILPGECFKDDVLIQILERHTVDMSNGDYYINHMNPWTEAGYYYVCLEYTYQKAKPAPVAKIRLLKPSQRNLYHEDTSPFLFLKCVEVTFNGTTFEVAQLYDYDPSYPDNKRIYSQLYAGVEDSLPVFEKMRDEGRLVYVHDRDEMFFGIDNRWESFNAVRANINTLACEEGDMIYIDEFGEAKKAISNNPSTLSQGIVLYVGNTDGKVRLFGECEKVNVEPGVSISIGDHLYLSSNVAGTITNLVPTLYPQYVGVALTNSDINNTCDILYLPNGNVNLLGGSGFDSILDFYQDLLHSSIFEYIFIEPFGNNDFIDSTNSNLTITTDTATLTGGTGDVYQTVSLQEPSYNTQLQVAQITAKLECTPPSSVKWYISNNGSDPLDWEVAELDMLHYFSSYRIEFSTVSGTFEVGENVLSGTTNKMATINGINSGQILVFGDTKYGTDYTIGETITGQTSGAVGVISGFVNRQNTSYHDLRVKIEFDGNAGDCLIYDYGVLYDQDEDIFNLMPSENDMQANIDTLYLDLYAYPSQDSDGFPNLNIPIQTQLYNLRHFIDETCCERLDIVEGEIEDINQDIDHINQEIDAIDTTTVGLLVQQVDTLNNDLNTIYNDVYETPHRDDDGSPNRSESIEESLANLQYQIDNISNSLGVRNPMFITSSTPVPDVAANPSIIRIDYNSALTITNFDNGVTGQELVIIFTNSNVIIEHNSNIHLLNDTNFYGQNEYVLTLVHNGTCWIEKTRSIPTYVV